MRKKITVLLLGISVTFWAYAQTTNPNVTPISIDCWGLQQNSFNLSPNIYKHYSCFELPESGTVNITGTREVDLTAGKQVHLKPGFSVNSLTGNGNFHTAVEKEEVGVAVFAPSGTFGEVPKCEKLELGLNLPPDIDAQIDNYFNSIPHNINPFDPDQISVEAVFTHYDLEALNYYEQYILPPNVQATGTVRKSFGFYYEEYHTETDGVDPHGRWVKDTTSFTFRVRFSPNKTGIWRTEIVIKIDNQIVYTLKPIYFKCTPTSRPGFIVGGETTSDKRHFVFENGDAFFGIGQNIPWPDKKNAVMPSGHALNRAQPPLGYDSLRLYITELAEKGGNLVRLINAEWTDAIEWEKLGDYQQAMPFAWEFDRTFDLLTEKEVYTLWCLNLHVPWMYHNNVSPDDATAWPNNPYNLELGLSSIESFFTDPDAKRYFKRKLRYMMARWGYSPEIAALQLMSEINFMAEDPIAGTHPYYANSTFRGDVADWFITMKDFIQIELGYNFNIGSSYTSDLGHEDANGNYIDLVDGNLLMEKADFNDWHPYSDGRNRNLIARWEPLNGENYNLQRHNKPMIIGENGLDKASKLYKSCGEEDWHNDLWASAMMGGWASGLHWGLWKGEHNVRQNFDYISTFFETYIDFKNIEWEPRRWPINNIDLSTYDKSRDDFFEVFYMTGDVDFINDKRAFGWVHNRSSYWYNKKSTCEDNIITLNNIPTPADNDDFPNVTLQSGSANKKNRKIRLENLSSFQRYDIDWFDPYTGAHLTTTDETHFFLGKLRVTLPEEINTTQYKDLVFLLRPKNSSFMNPFQQIIPFESIENSLSLLVTNSENSVNLDSLDNFNDIRIYPNPTRDIVNIESIETIQKIEIYNIDGKKIREENINDNFIKLSLQGLPKGIYNLKIFSFGGITNKIVVYQ